MDWLERTAKLRQWSRGGTRAPHKPLLFLYALGPAAQEHVIALAGRRLIGPQPGAHPVAAVHRSWHTSQVFHGSPRPAAAA